MDARTYADGLIRFPALPGSTGAVIDLMLVLSNHGRTIHTIVSRLVPPGSANAAPASIQSDAEKLGGVDDRTVDIDGGFAELQRY